MVARADLMAVGMMDEMAVGMLLEMAVGISEGKGILEGLRRRRKREEVGSDGR